jgi:hypothetical protein
LGSHEWKGGLYDSNQDVDIGLELGIEFILARSYSALTNNDNIMISFSLLPYILNATEEAVACIIDDNIDPATIVSDSLFNLLLCALARHVQGEPLPAQRCDLGVIAGGFGGIARRGDDRMTSFESAFIQKCPESGGRTSDQPSLTYHYVISITRSNIKEKKRN